MAPITAIISDVESCVSGDAEAKKDALRALTAAIDPADETYDYQKRAASRLLPSVLMQLLEDDNAAVAVEAANCLAAIVDHSGVVTDNLEAARFAATPATAMLNPVQETAGAMDGVFGVLLNQQFSDDEALSAAGVGAIAALTTLNRPNTVALIREVVKRLAAGEPRALGALADLLVGLEVRDDLAVVVDQALPPALGFLRTGSAGERAAAATLLGAIAEGRRGAAEFLVAEGALPQAAALLVEGDLEARDAAAALAWALVKDDRKLLAPTRDALGVAGAKLVEPLLELVEKGEAEDEADEGEEGGDGEAVDNGDAALLLLRALAAQDEDVKQQLKGEGGLIATRSCAIM